MIHSKGHEIPWFSKYKENLFGVQFSHVQEEPKMKASLGVVDSESPKIKYEVKEGSTFWILKKLTAPLCPVQKGAELRRTNPLTFSINSIRGKSSCLLMSLGVTPSRLEHTLRLKAWGSLRNHNRVLSKASGSALWTNSRGEKLLSPFCLASIMVKP